MLLLKETFQAFKRMLYIGLCIGICDAGTFSSTGYEPCSPCPIGQYNPHKQRTSCYQCPNGKSTSLTGRRFESECHRKFVNNYYVEMDSKIGRVEIKMGRSVVDHHDK